MPDPQHCHTISTGKVFFVMRVKAPRLYITTIEISIKRDRGTIYLFAICTVFASDVPTAPLATARLGRGGGETAVPIPAAAHLNKVICTSHNTVQVVNPS
jgi:hypothetical protein